ncbi:MAG: hypothetical protein AAFY43_02305 [Pseudomonadota bacterium]
MIRAFISSILMSFACVGLASADTRAVYTISDIPVDQTAESVIEAQQRAFAEARLIGARRMIQKITLAEDRAEVGGVPVDMSLADSFVAAVDVQEETRGGGRYRGTLSAVLNPRMVRSYLQSLDVPYVDRQAPLALLVPVAPEDLDAAWANAWPDAIDGALAPLATARLGGYSANSDWGELLSETNATASQRAVIAELRGSEGAYSVALTQVTAAGRTSIGRTRATPDLESAAEAASAYLDAVWKRQSVVRSGIRTVTTANILYTSLAEWNTLRGGLSRSPLVSDFKIEGVARDGALISFAFAGDIQRLTTDLRQRGVDLDTDPQGWVMRSSMTALR